MTAQKLEPFSYRDSSNYLKIKFIVSNQDQG